jgi:hypothetical protein
MIKEESFKTCRKLGKTQKEMAVLLAISMEVF